MFILTLFILNTANAKNIYTDYCIRNSCLIKTGIKKIYGIGFILLFFETFWKNFVFL